MDRYKIIIAAVFITATGAAVAGDSVPITANIGVVSNYMWRGLTQTQDDLALQGGLDYAHESGLSLGTWLSNVDWGTPDPNYEIDFYAGYGNKFGDLGYNLKTVYYAYPDGNDANFWEVDVSGSWNMLTVGLAYTLDGQPSGGNPYRDGDIYYYASLSYDLFSDFKLGGTLGYTDFDDLGGEGDYTHWQLSVSKDVGNFGTFSLTYDENDGGRGDDGGLGDIVAVDDAAKFWIGWKKTF